jgi:hypothetical protein
MSNATDEEIAGGCALCLGCLLYVLWWGAILACIIVLTCVLTCRVACGQTSEFLPIREYSKTEPSPTYADLKSHTVKGLDSQYKDLITWSHEASHTLNKEDKFQHLYLLHSKEILLSRETNIKLRDVAANIPLNWRGPGFQLYLIKQQRYFNNDPLYVLNEWTAYLHGALTALELHQRGILPRTDRVYEADIRKTIEFMRYGHVLLYTMQASGLDYKDYAKLKWVIKALTQRTVWVYNACKGTSLRDRQTEAMFLAGPNKYTDFLRETYTDQWFDTLFSEQMSKRCK